MVNVLNIFGDFLRKHFAYIYERELEITVHGADGPVRDKIRKFVVMHRSLGEGLVATRFLHIRETTSVFVGWEGRTSVVHECHDLLDPSEIYFFYQSKDDVSGGTQASFDDPCISGDIRQEFSMNYLTRYGMEIGRTALEEAAEPRRLLKNL